MYQGIVCLKHSKLFNKECVRDLFNDYNSDGFLNLMHYTSLSTGTEEEKSSIPATQRSSN